jgi:formylglycine-generating enzyme
MGASRALMLAYVVVGLPANAAFAVTIETVPVGDPGNAADTRVMSDGTTGYGSVGYTYNVGKYEVTTGQYTEFLNAVAKTDTYGLYSTAMWSHSKACKIEQSGSSGSYTYSVASDYANRPVSFVSYWDACRFANWLHNGQPMGAQGAGTTETGAYTLDGYNETDGWTIQRNADWKWAVTSEDEWYKAAYYKGGSTNAGYWNYPTGSSAVPGRDMADVSGNNANYYTGYGPFPIDSGQYYTTVVGEFQNSDSPYGTFDQGGNVFEWNEAVFGNSYRGLRGGSFYNPGGGLSLEAYYRGGGAPPVTGLYFYGFRVVQVPEPAALLLLAVGGVVMVRRRRVSR